MIAGISRSAAAAGLALAAWCDFRTVDESAAFGVFCQRFGVPMSNGPTARVVDANEA